jgi:Protein of unknown function (DUF1573)
MFRSALGRSSGSVARSTLQVYFCGSKVARRLTFLTLGLVPLLFGCESSSTPTPPEPLAWEGPFADRVDYLVGESESALVRFEFRNTSRRSVHFAEVKADCRCTSAGLPEGEFAPGSGGALEFHIHIDDTPDQIVGSNAFAGYACGTEMFGHLFQIAINKRRKLVASPPSVELVAKASGEATLCEGRLELTRYTLKDRPFDEYRVRSEDVVGELAIVSDEGWGPIVQDGGFKKQTRGLLLRTKPGAPPSGTARVSILAGEQQLSVDTVGVQWCQENLASMEPKTVLVSKGFGGCQIRVVSHIGPPRDISWALPDGFAMSRTAGLDPAQEARVTLSLNKGAEPTNYPKTEPFAVIVKCGEKTVRLTGTIVMLGPP